MISSTLISSKFFLPILSSSRVERRHLINRMEEGVTAGRTVTLISAPAGYGKSTLAAEWIFYSRRPVAWLSLEEIDDDPLRFFTYFFTSLQRVEKSIGADLLPHLEAGQLPPQEILISTLINNLAAIPSIILCVLDDFHFIQDKTILKVLQEVAAYRLPHFHLVLSTREDPALPLARWRGYNQITEIRAADLRFSEDEAGHFLCSGMGLNLSPRDISLLEEKTEGWIVGLQLVGISLQGHENPAEFVETINGSHRFILGYLTEEVIKSQPPDVQEFLLKTSILSKLNGSLCNALTGQTDSDRYLEKLLASNLFIIPLDDEGREYRYHHLFAELLTSLLQRYHPEWLFELHQLASQWYEQQRLPAEAIEHALAVRDYPRVNHLLEHSGWELLNQGYTRKMEAWMQALPPEWKTHSPRTCLNFAWVYLLRGNFKESSLYLRQAQAALNSLEMDDVYSSLQAESLALQANLAQIQNDIKTSVEAARASLELTPPENTRVTALALLALGAAYRQFADFDLAAETLQQSIRASREAKDWVAWMLAVSHLTLMSIQHGRLRFSFETALNAINQVQQMEIVPPPIVGTVYGSLGYIACETNHLQTAREYLNKGIRLGTFTGHTASLIYIKIVLARLLQGEGNLNAAMQTMEEAAKLLESGSPGWALPEFIYRRVSLMLLLGDISGAESVLRQSGVTPENEITRRTDWIHLAWLRFFMAQKERGTLALAERILQFSEADRRDGTTQQTLILGALAGGGPHWLSRALMLAEPEGYQRIFLDEGAPMISLLQGMPQNVYAQRLLALFPSPSSGAPPSSQPELVEPLTGRELEVLHLLAEGLSYSEIAARMMVSVNTVRYHIKGIYSKLGVEKQAQAIERGRQLGLL